MNMRKTAAVCGILLGVLLLGSTVQADTVARGMNLRSGSSATSSLIGSVPKGAEVTVLSSQNGWDYISYNGAKGWIHGGNITSSGASQTSASGAGASGAAVGTTSNLTVEVLYGMNFRAKPGMDGRIMGGIPKGTVVQYLGSSNGWDKVVYNGVTGWIASGRISAASEAASGAAGAAASNNASASQKVKVLYGMNFRAKPGMDGRIMGGIPKGTVVQYLGSSNGWDKVVYNGVTGWIASGRTSAVSNASQNTAASSASTNAAAGSTAAGTTVTVFNAMNFRAAGNLNGAKIGLIPAGSKVIHVTTVDGWQQVIYNGQSGWIKGGNTR